MPNGCDRATDIGAFLNFPKMRLWCASNGVTDFGPYGGVPSEEGEGEGGEGEGDYDDLDVRADEVGDEGDDYMLDDTMPFEDEMPFEYDQTLEGDEDVA